MARTPTVRPGRKPRGFFVRRWRGDIDLATLFWRDLLLVGSAINIAAILASLVGMANGMPGSAAFAVYFAPVPYNLFLFACVWRTAEEAAPLVAIAARGAALVWLVLACVL